MEKQIKKFLALTIGVVIITAAGSSVAYAQTGGNQGQNTQQSQDKNKGNDGKGNNSGNNGGSNNGGKNDDHNNGGGNGNGNNGGGHDNGNGNGGNDNGNHNGDGNGNGNHGDDGHGYGGGDHNPPKQPPVPPRIQDEIQKIISFLQRLFGRRG